MPGPLGYAAIRAQIPICRVLAILNWQPVSCRGDQWRGFCPLRCASSRRPDRQTDFSVHTQRNLFRCFRCQLAGNQLDLWALYTGLHLYPATLDLCRRLAIAPVMRENWQPKNPA